MDINRLSHSRLGLALSNFNVNVQNDHRLYIKDGTSHCNISYWFLDNISLFIYLFIFYLGLRSNQRFGQKLVVLSYQLILASPVTKLNPLTVHLND